jgi:general secretion pathway protein G
MGFLRPERKFLRRQRPDGFSLVEMLVVMAILSVLAAVTLPYAEMTVKRDKELELKRDLREIREAIDKFHGDWVAHIIPQKSWDSSGDGYPKTLALLALGARQVDPMKPNVKYLRHLPENPFGYNDLPPAQQWGMRGYRDPSDGVSWGGEDVYDVYCPGDEKALDGSYYHDW